MMGCGFFQVVLYVFVWEFKVEVVYAAFVKGDGAILSRQEQLKISRSVGHRSDRKIFHRDIDVLNGSICLSFL